MKKPFRSAGLLMFSSIRSIMKLKREDWVCHEMWMDDGKTIIYHGGYQNGPAMVGRCTLDFSSPDSVSARTPHRKDEDMPAL